MAQHAFAKDYMERCTSVLGARCVCKTGARHKHRGILFCTTDAVQKVKGCRLVVLVVTVVTVVVPRVAPTLDRGRKNGHIHSRERERKEKKRRKSHRRPTHPCKRHRPVCICVSHRPRCMSVASVPCQSCPLSPETTHQQDGPVLLHAVEKPEPHRAAQQSRRVAVQSRGAMRVEPKHRLVPTAASHRVRRWRRTAAPRRHVDARPTRAAGRARDAPTPRSTSVVRDESQRERVPGRGALA